LDFALPVGNQFALRSIDIAAALGGGLVFVALLTGWRPPITPLGILVSSTLLLLIVLDGAGSFFAGLDPKDIVFGIRLSYLIVFSLLSCLALEARIDAVESTTKLIIVAGALQAALVLLQYGAYLWLGAAGAVGADLVYKAVHLRDIDDPIWWAGGVIRPSGSFGHPNGVGGFLAVSAASSTAWTMISAGRSSRILQGALSVALLVAILVTGSRGALLICGLGVLTVFLLVRQQQSNAWVSVVLIMMTATALAVGIAANAPDAPVLERPFHGGGWNASTSSRTIQRAMSTLQIGRARTTSGRTQTWGQAIDVIRERPEGIGLSHLLRALRSSAGVAAAHNSYLLIAGAMGLPIAISFCFLVGLAIARSLDRSAYASPSEQLQRSVILAVLGAFALSLMFEDRIQDPSALVGPAALIGLGLRNRINNPV